MEDWEEYGEFQKALNDYLIKSNMRLDVDFTYKFGIDCVFVFAEDKPVFIIGLPPPSNYRVRETEYTDKYMRFEEAIAV